VVIIDLNGPDEERPRAPLTVAQAKAG
jgi:hypothetical protein